MEMEKKTLSVKDFVRAASIKSNGGKTQKELRECVDLMSDTLIDLLASTNKNVSIEVKVIPGASFVCEYVPSKEARNPRTGEVFMASPRKRVRVKISKKFKDDVNE